MSEAPAPPNLSAVINQRIGDAMIFGLLVDGASLPRVSVTMIAGGRRVLYDEAMQPIPVDLDLIKTVRGLHDA